MDSQIEAAIIREAKKRLARYSQKQYFVHKYRKSFRKRTGVAAKASAHTLPSSWTFHRHFDPRYCINHARFLSKGIWASLQAGAYIPVVAQRLKFPKPNGDFRNIDSFSIPDAAIATIFFNRIRKRNAKIFSDSSFAYQEGKTPFDAILKIKPLLNREKVFVSQYDFSKYFDNIGHSFVTRSLGLSGPFLTTSMERALIQSVMTHTFSDGLSSGVRSVGTPQGNTLSLFVANVAAHSLDQELSILNGSFARFADDCVVINYAYEDALKCAEAFAKFSEVSGVSINRDKSIGIRLFSERPAEMANIGHFNFLSYRFSPSGLSVSEKSIRTIKLRCAKIIYNNLLLHPRRTGKISAKRFGAGFYDWDLVTCINELRKYIYGGLSQSKLEGYLAGTTKVGRVLGAVSYFSLVEQGHQFRALDGWLLDVIRRALKKRREIVKAAVGKTLKPVTMKKLTSGEWYNFPGLDMETKMPSFFLAWRSARKSWAQHGLGGVDTTGMGYSY
ncbi:reverse transcriptase domain-containing protein [Mesorhizobium sp. 113-3-9]|uniref:reverse transcriptase domain-containing protein n=1 Tax=Mesorhizobium sp. 113-3-9 TaxID=2744517 RepID=UPI0019283A82|nr:reverse transcriptase domain-containing protein [Mesorhizobium sp. 113-3-9]